MPHGFDKQGDEDGFTTFRKLHDTGEETWVQVERQANGNWIVNVRDPNGNRQFGPFGAKGSAMDRAKRFMRDNPKGVPAENRGISGMGGGIPGMDGNGMF